MAMMQKFLRDCWIPEAELTTSEPATTIKAGEQAAVVHSLAENDFLLATLCSTLLLVTVGRRLRPHPDELLIPVGRWSILSPRA